MVPLPFPNNPIPRFGITSVTTDVHGPEWDVIRAALRTSVGSEAGFVSASAIQRRKKGVFLDITRPNRPRVDRDPDDDDVEDINAPPAPLIKDQFLKPVDEERRRQFVKAAQQLLEKLAPGQDSGVIARVLAVSWRTNSTTGSHSQRH